MAPSEHITLWVIGIGGRGKQALHCPQAASKNELTSTDGWLPIVPPAPDGWTSGTGGSIMISDPEAADHTQRFYRIEARTPGAE